MNFGTNRKFDAKLLRLFTFVLKRDEAFRPLSDGKFYPIWCFRWENQYCEPQSYHVSRKNIHTKPILS